MILARIYVSFGENHENSERLGPQARPGIEPGTSRLPVCECSYWWSQERTARHPCLTRDSNPEPQVQQPASLIIMNEFDSLIAHYRMTSAHSEKIWKNFLNYFIQFIFRENINKF